MKNFVLLSITLLLSLWGYSQENIMYVNDQLPKVGVSPNTIGGALLQTPHVSMQYHFDRGEVEGVVFSGDTCVIVWWEEYYVRIPVEKEKILIEKPWIFPIEEINPDNNFSQFASYNSKLCGVRIVFFRIKPLENMWKQTYFSKNRVAKSDMIVCIFKNDKNPNQLQQVRKSINMKLTKNMQAFDLLVPFGDLIWSGRGYANFGKPATYIK